MDRIGSKIGFTLAAAICAAFWMALTGDHHFAATKVFDIGIETGLAAILFPLGWLFGRHFDRVKRLSERDSLSGLFNREFVERCYNRAMNRAASAQKRMSLVLIDLNDFKNINDRYGHCAGDEAIRRVANVLQGCARRGEIVSRWGGDEFLLLCPYAEREELEVLRLGIEEKLACLSEQEGKPLTISAGTAEYPGDGETLSQLTASADKRLYENKQLTKTKPPSLRREA